ncbi:MAG: helix-turn-helix transcriptional regulator [Bacilli bacterium]|nr:helix-turn-helix transcriptional regulator [Bacilli bacterium]
MTNSKQYWKQVIGANIKKYRKLKKMTQASLAEAIDCSENMIAKVESKTKQGFSFDLLLNISNVLEISLHQLYDTSILEENKKDK